MTEFNLEFLENNFDILEKLGHGGMGQVFKAYQKSMDRLVAIKILQSELNDNLVFVERFKREARIAGKFSHPNAIQVYDIGYDHGQYYFVMEYVDGISLKEKLRIEGRFEQKYTITIMQQMLSVLRDAEKMNIIHRDIKPDNIMFTAKGVAKLADLGLAREIDDDAGLTQQKIAIGTPHYMSPEQAQGKPVDMRADQYSLGVTAFHMLTGKTPFTGKNTMEILVHHVKTQMPTPSSFCKGITPEMDKIILKMTEKKPENRYQSIEEIIKALESVNEKVTIKRTTKRKKKVQAINEPLSALEKRKEKNAYVGLLIVAALFMLIVGFYFMFNQMRPSSVQNNVSVLALDRASRLESENRFEESLYELKSALPQIPASEQPLLVEKINELEKKLAGEAAEKIMLVSFDSVERCENGLKELAALSKQTPSAEALLKSHGQKLHERILKIKAEEAKLLEKAKSKALDDAINNLSVEVNNHLANHQYQQAYLLLEAFKAKNEDPKAKISQISTNIINLENEYQKDVFIKVEAFQQKKDFDKAISLLNSAKENFRQKENGEKIEQQIKKTLQLKKDLEKESAKKSRLEFLQTKDAIFGLLKIAEIKAAKTKLDQLKENGLPEDDYDFFAKIIDNYSRIYARIETGLANEFKDKVKLERIGNRNLNANIVSVSSGIISYTFMDSKMELTSLNDDWAQTYTAIAEKIARTSKGCRMIRISHFAYANGDLEGAYFLMKEAEKLGLDEHERSKYTKTINDDFLNWLDIYFENVIEKANILIKENNKQRANVLLSDFIKKYGDTVIYKERQVELETVFSQTLQN